MSSTKTYEGVSNRVSNIATIAAPVIAMAAFFLSGFTYWETTKIQKKVAAFTFWQSYLQLAAQKPKLANGKFDPGNAEEKEAYDWFASSALGAAETVYHLQKDDEGWKKTIQTLIRTHRDFIKGREFERGHYDPAFRALIDETLKEQQ